jgi:hypothetical protein
MQHQQVGSATDSDTDSDFDTQKYASIGWSVLYLIIAACLSGVVCHTVRLSFHHHVLLDFIISAHYASMQKLV